MKRKWAVTIASGALVISLLTTSMSFAGAGRCEITTGTIEVTNQSESEFPAMSKVPMVTAMQTALKSVPGRILKSKLGEEDGFLIYDIEVATPKKTIMNVKIDAGSGKVLTMCEDKADHGEHRRDDHEDHEREEHDHEDHEHDE